MHHDKQVVIRMPADLADRLSALVDSVAQDPTVAAGGRVSRSTVARLALSRGLASLERSARRRNGGK